MAQLVLVEVRRKPLPHERGRCGVDGCENLRELTAQGHEKAHCSRHRPTPLRVVARRPRYDIANRRMCASPGCRRLSELRWKRGGRSEGAFCDVCRKNLSMDEKRSIVPGYGLRAPTAGRPENLQLRRKAHGAGQAYCCADCGSSRVLPVELAS